MNPEIENLINMALADGEVTEKERVIILRKAEALGFDVDEAEMILDGKLHQRNALSTKEGTIRKCPNCGENVPPLAVKCEACNHEFRQTQSSANIKAFYHKLSTTELNEKASIIQSFPIPTNKEDIIEFLTLAVAGATEMTPTEMAGYTKYGLYVTKDLSYRQAEISAWSNKASMILKQSKILFANDLSMKMILENYETQLKTNANSESRKRKRNIIIILAFTILLFVFVGLMAKSENGEEAKEQSKLDKIELQIKKHIESKEFDNAIILTEQLTWTWKLNYPESEKKAQQYAEKRKSLKLTIEKMKASQ